MDLDVTYSFLSSERLALPSPSGPGTFSAMICDCSCGPTSRPTRLLCGDVCPLLESPNDKLLKGRKVLVFYWFACSEQAQMPFPHTGFPERAVLPTKCFVPCWLSTSLVTGAAILCLFLFSGLLVRCCLALWDECALCTVAIGGVW